MRRAPLAKTKALKLVKGWKQPHKDKLFEVDQAVDLSSALRRQYGYFLHLTKASEEKPFEVMVDYIPIDKA